MPSVIPQWIQDVNTVLGLIGFVITAVVMIQVGTIKRSFRSRARLPEIVTELEQAGSALSAALDGWPSKRNIAQSHIKISASLMQSALQFVPNPTRRQVRQMHKKFEVIAKVFADKKYDNADPVWDLYSDIQSVIVSLKQATKNLNWE